MSKLSSLLMFFFFFITTCLIGTAFSARPSRHARRLDTPVTPFNRNNFENRYFLTPYPSDSLLSQSYPIRETLTSLQGRSMPERQMAYTEAEFHLANSKESNGLIQFRQVSDMWLTEIKGVLQQLPPSRQMFLIIHESKKVTNVDCSNLGPHLNPYKHEHGDPAVLADKKTTKLTTHLGDLSLIASDNQGYAPINMQSLHVSLYNDSSSIVGHAIGVHELVDEKGTLGRVIACGNIYSSVKLSPAKFQKSKKPKRTLFQ